MVLLYVYDKPGQIIVVIDMFSKSKQFTKELHQAYNYLQKDDGSFMAAAVSFYLAISFFPLLLVLISIMGLLLRYTGWGQDAQARLFELIGEQTAPVLAKQIETVLTNVQDSATVGGPLGLLTLFLASLAVFVCFDGAMDRIWNVQGAKTGFLTTILNIFLHRLRAFLMLIGIGVFALMGFIASMSLSAVERYADQWLPMSPWIWKLVMIAMAVGLNWLLFALIYKFLPKVPIKWSEAARGALFTAIMWEVGRRLLASFIIGGRFGIYGIVGAFIAIMLWMFYAIMILFLGAEYIQVLRNRCTRPKK